MTTFDEDIVSNQSGNPTIHDVVAAQLTRRAVLRGGVAVATVGSLAGLLDAIPAQAGSRTLTDQLGRRGRRSALVGFQAIPPSSADTVVVPPGYTARS